MVAEHGYAHGSGDELAIRYAANAREDVGQVEAELQKISDGIFALMDKNPILSEGTGEPKVFYYKMKSNFYRYLAECATGDTQSKVAEEVADALVMFWEAGADDSEAAEDWRIHGYNTPTGPSTRQLRCSSTLT